MGWLDDCRKSCVRTKYVAEHMSWVPKPNHSGSLIAKSQLLDHNMVTIPGLYFKGVYTARRMSGEVYSFGLMQTVGLDHFRVFMIDVYPSHIVSHRAKDEALFGPHLHLGDERKEQITRNIMADIDKVTMTRWMDRFRRHARVSDSKNFALSHAKTGTLFQ